MEQNTFDQHESAMKRASKKRADEDILEISSTGYGYESRGSNSVGTGEKQGTDESEHM